MIPQSPTFAARALPALLALYCAASFVHFWHNAEFLADYPNLPAWLTRAQVYGVWRAPVMAHSGTMHATIWSEVVAAALVLVAVAGLLFEQSRPS